MTTPDAGEVQRQSRDAAANRIALAVKSIALVQGEPRLSNLDQWAKGRTDGHGDKLAMSAVWFIDGKNHGIGIDWYHAGKVNIRAWGNSNDWRVSIWARNLTYHRLIEAAMMVGLLEG